MRITRLLKSKNLLLRRSRNILCYWADGKLVFENYATGLRISADPLTCKVLDFFDRWRSAAALVRRMSQYGPSSLRKAALQLARYSLLERSDRPRLEEQAMETWKHWNPAAGLLHFSTKDLRYASDPLVEARFLRRRAKTMRLPPPVKHYPRARQFRLPKPQTEGEFAKVLLARRTWRRFSRNPLELAALGTLLRLTWGVQRWIKVPGLGSVALKTSPSGGARHPIEVYVLALRVAGLPRGLYHYAADTHRLELLRRGASPREATRFLAGQSWFGPAAALFLMTAVFVRSQWKYPFARAYRAVLLDAGHICQTFCLVATWLGLAPFCTLALADSQIEKMLGVDGVTESLVYAAGVGARPSDAEGLR